MFRVQSTLLNMQGKEWSFYEAKRIESANGYQYLDKLYYT